MFLRSHGFIVMGSFLSGVPGKSKEVLGHRKSSEVGSPSRSLYRDGGRKSELFSEFLEYAQVCSPLVFLI